MFVIFLFLWFNIVMLRWLKKLFIPHKHNNYKPHIFRETSAFVIFVIIIVLFFVSIGGRSIVRDSNMLALVLPNVLVDYTNENRATENFKNLTINPVLEKAAQLKANDMAEKGYFAHQSPDGNSPWYFFKQAGYDFSYAGENLAVNFSDSVEVSEAWMASPGHRANIMNNDFTEIGIATAEGMYQGKKTVFVVQMFGRPAKKTIPVAVTETVKKSTPPPAVNSQMVLAESVSPDVTYSSFVDRVVVSPGKTLSLAYLIISLLIFIGLVLMIFIEIKRQHPRMILLALGLLIVILGLLYIYRFVLFSPLIIA
jgi:hypothetical protein